MVARRAHNPEVARFKSRLRTQNNKKDIHTDVLFVILMCAAADLPRGAVLCTTSVARWGSYLAAVGDRNRQGTSSAVVEFCTE